MDFSIEGNLDCMLQVPQISDTSVWRHDAFRSHGRGSDVAPSQSFTAKAKTTKPARASRMMLHRKTLHPKPYTLNPTP